MFKWLKSWLPKPKPQPLFQIWCILEGPISVDDMPEDEIPETATDTSVFMVLKVADNSHVFDAEFWFDHMDDAYAIVKHFQTSIEPINLNIKEYELVK